MLLLIREADEAGAASSAAPEAEVAAMGVEADPGPVVQGAPWSEELPAEIDISGERRCNEGEQCRGGEAEGGSRHWEKSWL